MRKEDFKVFVHGRPQGHDIYPKDGLSDVDTLYLKSFLDSSTASDVKDALLTDIVGNTVYYTYIRRKDVVEKGRDKGYFAITLRCNKAICTYVSELYRLFGEIYAKCCQGIIATENGQQTFRVKAFAEKSKDFETVLEEVSKLITTGFAPYFEELGASNYDTRSKETKPYSTKDIDSILFREDMTKYRLVISSDYKPYYIKMATDAQNKSGKIDTLSKSLQQREETIKDHEEKIKEYEKTINDREEIIKCKDKEIEDLKSKLSKYDVEDFNKYLKDKKIIQEYIKIEEGLITLSRLLLNDDSLRPNSKINYNSHLVQTSNSPFGSSKTSNKNAHSGTTSQSKYKSKMSRVLLVSVLIVVVLTLVSLWFNNGNSKKMDVAANVKVAPEYKSLLEENQSLKNEVNFMKTKINRLKSAVVSDEKANKNQVKILLDSQSKTEVTVGKIYKLSLQNNNSDSYRYDVKGAGNLCENGVSVRVNRVGTITITCVNLKTQEAIAELQVDAK